MQRDPHRGSYVISHSVPIEIEVSNRAAKGSAEGFAI
jgi:hypothetical protein